MTTLTLVPSDAIVIHQADIRTTSLKVAEAFGKQHKDVLRKIENMDCSVDFASAHFCAHVQKVNIGNGASRESKVYEMTKDGFMFLVMGFTGKQAAQIKEAYINAFNVMAAQLAERQRPAETLTASEQQTLSEIAHKKAALHENVGKALAEIWSRVHNKFRIAKYDQLQRDQLADAIVYVSQLQLRAIKKPPVTITKKQFDELTSLMRGVQCGWVFYNDQQLSQWVSNRLRTELDIRTLQELPIEDFEKAKSIIQEMTNCANKFLQMINEGKEYFVREVIGNGMPFTPWVSRRMGGLHNVPKRPKWLELAAAVHKAS